MSNAKRIDEQDIGMRAKSLVFVGATKPIPPSKVVTPPVRKRWLPPKKNEKTGGYDVRHTGGEVRTFPTMREADDFFEQEAGIGKR